MATHANIGPLKTEERDAPGAQMESALPLHVTHGKRNSDFQLRSAALRCILTAGPEIDNGNPG
jgi:hypothetical protein